MGIDGTNEGCRRACRGVFYIGKINNASGRGDGSLPKRRVNVGVSIETGDDAPNGPLYGYRNVSERESLGQA